jgi:hypothetical protein
MAEPARSDELSDWGSRGGQACPSLVNEAAAAPGHGVARRRRTDEGVDGVEAEGAVRLLL